MKYALNRILACLTKHFANGDRGVNQLLVIKLTKKHIESQAHQKLTCEPTNITKKVNG